jgi:Domain of unknown function (DUF4386)
MHAAIASTSTQPVLADMRAISNSAPVWPVLWVTLFHAIVLTGGFFVLVSVFSFPDILREPAADRLKLFMENYSVVVPTYFALALTGLSQAALGVLIWLCAKRRDETFLVVSVLFGVLCGAFQIMGFMRWPIVIPYIAEAMAGAKTAEAQYVVVMMEGLMNRFAGMTIGEHLGFLGMGLWTLLLGFAIRKESFMDRRLGLAGIILGLATLVIAMEPLGGIFSTWGEITAALFAFWTTWLVLMAISLIRASKGIVEGKLPAWMWVAGLIYAIAGAVPAYLG